MILNIQVKSFMKWLPVPKYEGLYEVSDCGQIRSIDRVVVGKDGVNYPFKGRVLYQTPNKNVQYYTVNLWKNNKGSCMYTHRLVCEAFIPNPLDKPEVNHKDGNRQNNNISNLEWVTRGENMQHAHDTGLITYTHRLSYSEFVSCLQDVINGESYLSLSKRVPYKVPFLSVKLRKIAKELGLENDLNESLHIQKMNRAKINGSKNKRKS